MVLGIGEGKMEITSDKPFYKTGETVKGTVVLTLNSPKKAKGVKLLFYAERKVRGTTSRGRGTTRIERVHQQELRLGGEQQYPQGRTEYPFEFVVPPHQQKMEAPVVQGTGLGAGIANAALQLAANAAYSPLSWYLDAALDLSMSFDIAKKQLVNVVD